MLIVLAGQSSGPRAELLFRSAQQVNGEQRWSPVRKYSNPADIAYPRFSPNDVPVPAEEVRVFLTGEITPADVASAKTMMGLLESGRQKIAGNTVWLASNGGDIDAGMELGRRLRDRGLYTLVGRNDQCLSACVFVFMGGERRSVAGRLGIHRPFFPFTTDMPDRQARFRHLARVMREYIEELEFPVSLYDAVMLVPPESIQFLTPGELKTYYLEGISPSSEDRLDALAARRLGLTMRAYLDRKATAPACAFLEAGLGRCEGRVMEASASGGVADDPQGMKKGKAVSASAATRGQAAAQGPVTRR
jgi:ATP-dependent protease ClpP protease subunit